MKSVSAFTICVLVVMSPAALASDTFSFTAPGGAIPDDAVGVYPLFMDPEVPVIKALELDITGLSHEDPWDLDIYLIDPFGNTLEVMTDRGDSLPIVGVDLTFSDTALDWVPEPGPIVSGTYRPEGWPSPGFAQYVGGSGGCDAWILLMIDDAPGDVGSFDSFTLRVPEPMTLTLLAFGALATLRRKRR